MVTVLARYQQVFIVLVSCLTVVGCSGQGPTPHATVGALSTATVTPQRESLTAPATKTPIPTATLLTATPSRTAVPTKTQPTPTSTWTPVPTLPAEQAAQTLMELYEADADCPLPCWWGIVPGKTTWADARDRLAPLGTVWGPSETTLGSHYAFEIAVPPDLQGHVYVSPDLSVKDGQVVGINLNSSAISRDFDYSLAGWLETLGAPEEIWLYVQFDTVALPHYTLNLFYSSRGIMVNGSGFTEARGDGFVICPVPFQRGKFPNAVVMWSPELGVNHANLMDDLWGYNTEPRLAEFYPLADWTDDWEPDEFYATYMVADTTACFAVHPLARP